MEKVSVIIPVYNVERYVSRCIESIVNQTYPDIEILIVNDGSTDNSTSIIESWVKKDSRITHIYQINSGLSAARNAGMSKATGKYILFVDGDDYIAENCIDILWNEMQKDFEIDIVCFPYVKVFRKKRDIAKLFHTDCVFDQDVVRNVLLRKLIGPTDMEVRNPGEISRLNTAWGKLYRRKVIENEAFVDTKIIGVEDGWFNINVFKQVRKVAYTEKTFYFYEKENTNSLLHSYDKNYFERRKQAYQLIYSFLEENHLKHWEKFLNNRIVIEFIEMYRKILRSNLKSKERKFEIKKILWDAQYCCAIDDFNTEECSFVWKLFWNLCRGRHYRILSNMGGLAILYRRTIQWRK